MNFNSFGSFNCPECHSSMKGSTQHQNGEVYIVANCTNCSYSISPSHSDDVDVTRFESYNMGLLGFKLEHIMKPSDIKRWLQYAIEEAKKSNCHRSQCGAIVQLGDQIYGRGFNSPPNNKQLVTCRKDMIPLNFESDRTCCVHAEQRAMLDAVALNGRSNDEASLKGGRIFFIRLKDGKPVPAGKPYCTICSKLALDLQLKSFVLFHGEEDDLQAYEYPTEAYNELSFQSMRMRKLVRK